MNPSSPYKICPRCGTPNRMDARFCVRCGQNFTQVRGSAPSPANYQQQRRSDPGAPSPYPRPSSSGNNRPPSPYPYRNETGRGSYPNQPYPDAPRNAPRQSPRPAAPAPRPRPKKKKRILLPVLIGFALLLMILAAILLILFKGSGKNPQPAASASDTTVSSTSEGTTASGNVIRYAYLLKDDHAELSSYSLYQGGSNTKGYKAISDSFSDGTYTVPDTIEGLPVTVINTYAFYNPYASDPSITGDLKVVNLPDTVTFIDKNPFGGLPSLTDIHISTGSYYDVDGVLCGKAYDSDQTALIQYPLGRTAETYSVPEGITLISDQAFYGCSTLKEVTLPEGVREIRLYAFGGMANLNRLSLPASLTTIQNVTWIEGSSVSEVVLSSGNAKFTCDGNTLTGTDGTVYWSR